ncbi:hypothetical protein [Campylobacter sputorum]|uniref:hypothetical protein n=1 Tax=Campylobacter sputorum TaxID=206 RepID=UPI001E381C3C|nr:hypothetical protein [Campylobacter sputorum]
MVAGSGVPVSISLFLRCNLSKSLVFCVILSSVASLKNFAKNQSKWIFCDKKGDHLFGSPTLRKHWLKLISKTGIPYKPLRQTRHTFATYMVKKALKKDSKIELFWVSKILGHSTLKMKIDTYVRMFKDEHLKIDRDIDFY